MASEAHFEDCDFSGAKLANVNFGQCKFVHCRFAGELRDVVFDGRELTDKPAPPEMQNVDFSDAVLRDVEFKSFNLEAVTLPKDPDVRLVRRARCVARRGLAELESKDVVAPGMLRAVLEQRLRGPGTEQEARVFNRRDFLAMGGEELAALAEDVLRRAESECLKN